LNYLPSSLSAIGLSSLNDQDRDWTENLTLDESLLVTIFAFSQSARVTHTLCPDSLPKWMRSRWPAKGRVGRILGTEATLGRISSYDFFEFVSDSLKSHHWLQYMIKNREYWAISLNIATAWHDMEEEIPVR
jgi:hypothetical protein